jgi:hypothetical protein
MDKENEVHMHEKDKILTFVTTWMELDMIMLNEISPT